MNRFFSYFLTALVMFSVLVGLAGTPAAAYAQQPLPPSRDGLWSDFDETGLQAAGEPWLRSATRYRSIAAADGLQALLRRAPLENTAAAAAPLVINLPLPDGGSLQLAVVESPIMAEGLAMRYPEIKTYLAWGVNNPAVHGRLDWAGDLGFHAMLYTPQGIVFVDPYRRGDTTHYISYYKQDATRAPGAFTEYGPLGDNAQVEAILGQPGFTAVTGPTLRTYRTVVAATAEYTAYFGGTRELGQAAIVVSMNRINGIYESEVAIRMVLVPLNDQVVYFGDPSKDPYTNDDGFAMLGENQENVDSVIGSAYYDIGHVYSTGGGGVAYLGVPCDINYKAQGVTGSSAPVGDAYWVDYVAHEMGHQYGANHTFNSKAGSCGGGNRNASTAYEPGSGTTIMAYAGICGADDIQPHSDAYFHGVSFDEITAYTQAGDGNICAVQTSTGNQAPVVNAGANYSIPKSTPFTLTGSATDPDEDPLTYYWEGFDKPNTGNGGPPNNPSMPPFFRSFVPLAQPSRTFPQMSDIVNNVNTKGEILPGVAYLMHFRLTARDNHVSPSAGGVANAAMTVNVINTGPFLVTAPNTAVTWPGGSPQTVSWDVAGTTAAPINCANVDIALSTDGGYTYPVSLLAGTTNDGSETVTIPNIATTTARVRVACSNNIFFDISNTNFTITNPMAVLGITKNVAPTGSVTPGTALTYTIGVSNVGGVDATATTTDTFPAGLTAVVCEGTLGNLNIEESLVAGGAHTYTCTANVDASIALQVSAEVDKTQAYHGEVATVTLTVTNPHAGVTLSGVTVSDAALTTCTPALGVPFELAPGASQVITCPVTLTGDLHTATSVVAQAIIRNTAQVSAPGAYITPVVSLPVENSVPLSEEAGVDVTLIIQKIYLPITIR